jgi:hypothetical protein
MIINTQTIPFSKCMAKYTCIDNDTENHRWHNLLYNIQMVYENERFLVINVITIIFLKLVM